MNFDPSTRCTGLMSFQIKIQREPDTPDFPTRLPFWCFVDFTTSWQQNGLTARNYILGGSFKRVASRREEIKYQTYIHFSAEIFLGISEVVLSFLSLRPFMAASFGSRFVNLFAPGNAGTTVFFCCACMLRYVCMYAFSIE